MGVWRGGSGGGDVCIHIVDSGVGNGNPSNILAWKIQWTEEPDRL